MKKALIDADSLLYKVAFAIEEKTVWNEAEVAAGLEEPVVEYTTDIDQCFTTLDKLIEQIFFATETEEGLFVLTGSGNFRYDNPLGYKTHRKDLRKPTALDEIRTYILKNYECYTAEGMEADDYVVYKKTVEPEEWFLCAIDKDVLYQTVGDHYNYGNDEYLTISPRKALNFEYYQCLVGDTSDGYKGCPGIGPVKAKAILKECKDEQEIWASVVEAYKKKGLTEEDAINTMRLCSMHQYDGDKVVLWTPPKIN